METYLVDGIGILGNDTLHSVAPISGIVAPIPDVAVKTRGEKTEQGIGLEPLLLLLFKGDISLA